MELAPLLRWPTIIDGMSLLGAGRLSGPWAFSRGSGVIWAKNLIYIMVQALSLGSFTRSKGPHPTLAPGTIPRRCSDTDRSGPELEAKRRPARPFRNTFN